MGRFITPIVESVGPGPSVMAPGDGLEGIYHGFLNSVPANGQCLVVVPGLDPLHHLEAICAPNAAGSIGDPVLVNVDDQKQLWVVTGTTSVPLTGSAWITPTLLNSWVNLTPGWPPAGYMKDPMGFVHLRGEVNGGVNGSIIFMLPSGYRPGGGAMNLPAVNGASAFAYLQIATSGTVEAVNVSGGLSLNVAPFLAEN